MSVNLFRQVPVPYSDRETTRLIDERAAVLKEERIAKNKREEEDVLPEEMTNVEAKIEESEMTEVTEANF